MIKHICVTHALCRLDLQLRALRAINTVLMRELHEHDGVLLRLACNLEDSHLEGDDRLTLEYCELIEGMV
jgi:hypothetical protein